MENAKAGFKMFSVRLPEIAGLHCNPLSHPSKERKQCRQWCHHCNIMKIFQTGITTIWSGDTISWGESCDIVTLYYYSSVVVHNIFYIIFSLVSGNSEQSEDDQNCPLYWSWDNVASLVWPGVRRRRSGWLSCSHSVPTNGNRHTCPMCLEFVK